MRRMPSTVISTTLRFRASLALTRSAGSVQTCFRLPPARATFGCASPVTTSAEPVMFSLSSRAFMDLVRPSSPSSVSMHTRLPSRIFCDSTHCNALRRIARGSALR